MRNKSCCHLPQKFWLKHFGVIGQSKSIFVLQGIQTVILIDMDTMFQPSTKKVAGTPFKV